MAKFTILIALLAATLLFAAAHASPKLHHHEKQSTCDSIMERVDLSPCEDYVMQRIQKYEEDEYDEEENHVFMKNNEEYKRRCCNELSEFESLYGGRTRCMCRAKRQILNSQRDKVESRSQLEDLKSEISRLPNACGIELYERIGCRLD